MPARNAAELCHIAAIKPPAKDLLQAAMDARHFAELLVERKYWMQAIAYLAHAIPPRESIWWAWFCARKAALPKSDPEELKALGLAEAWIGQPTEENRIAAWKYSERQSTGATAQSVLEAIYYTGEIINEGTGEKSPPVPYLTSKFVHSTVLAAVYSLNPKEPEVVAKDFIKQGFEVANRIQLWSQYTS